jgi:hypothetical protein
MNDPGLDAYSYQLSLPKRVEPFVADIDTGSRHVYRCGAGFIEVCRKDGDSVEITWSIVIDGGAQFTDKVIASPTEATDVLTDIVSQSKLLAQGESQNEGDSDE